MSHSVQQAEAKYQMMTTMPIPKLILRLGIPTIASMLITSVYNMTDTYFVGQLGKSASGAIGIVFSLMAIFQAFGFMFGHGAGSNISRRLGQHDTESATRFASTGFFLALLTGAVIGVLGLCLLTPLMYFLGSTDTILPFARDYGVWILLAGPLFTGSCVLNNILRYEGMSFFAMIGLVSGGFLNMILDPILIFGFHMGTSGAGLSTAISQAVSFLILLYMFLAGRTESKLKLSKVSRQWRDIWLIVATGLPSLIRQGLASLSGLLLNHQAGIYGDAAVAAMSIVNRITSFIFSVGLGMGQGYQPVAAFNYGAKIYSRVRKGFWFTGLAGEVLLGVGAAACILFARPLVAVFQPDPEVVAIAFPALIYQSAACFFLPLSVCANMMFQSVGLSGRASFLSALRSGLLFIPLILLLPLTLDLLGVQIAQAVSDVLTFLISMPLALHFLRRLPQDQPV
ncbi:MAG TPA: MATE family efflux transporter [Candidatus Avoscillospira avicola]|uniref:Multidrug export protein MepA n=1 Tax=Candidatus Avoscillospira avicola TaxID=2840706 RepID=A0A9D1DJA3_9FIRM|nr:MATE family efflux transporter [Candidatus Avoscillospira avicola]